MRVYGYNPHLRMLPPHSICLHATRTLSVDDALALAAQIMGIEPAALDVRPNEELGQGEIYAESVPGLTMTIGAVATYARSNSMYTIQAADSLRQVNGPPAYVAHFTEIEVDTETGVIRPVRMVAGSDARTVINPNMAVGQLEGGLVQELGFAFFEDASIDPETGQPLSRGMITDGKIPIFGEIPLDSDTISFFAQTHEPTGPFGAKGIGEAALNPVAAAFSNAVYNALGVRFRELPITPEKVLEALANRENEGIEKESATKEKVLA